MRRIDDPHTAAHIFPFSQTPSVESQDGEYWEGWTGFVDAEPMHELDECGLCQRGICIWTHRTDLDGNHLVVHGSYLA